MAIEYAITVAEVIADPTGLGLVRVGTGTQGLLQKLSSDGKFIERRDEMFRGWIVELVQRLAALEQAFTHAERAEYDRRTADDEFMAVTANYFRAAHQEPLEERRRMLAFAAASIANLDLSVAELARVQRVIRELDPSDVVELYRLWLVPSASRDPRRSRPDDAAVQRYYFWENTGAAILETSGCLSVEAWLQENTDALGGRATRKEAYVTAIGRNLLAAMRPYLAARAPDVADIPGHAVAATFRSKTAAEAAVAELIPNYRELLSASRKGLRYFCPNPFGEVDPPTQTGAVLELVAPSGLVAELRSKVVPLSAMPFNAESVQIAHVLEPNSDGFAHVRVVGPHDVLRHIAYEYGAVWSPFHYAF